jgi:hypothetical protein
MTVNPNFDLRRMLNVIKSGGQREMHYVHCWTGWGWYQMAYAKEVLADSYVLSLHNLGRPKAL